MHEVEGGRRSPLLAIVGCLLLLLLVVVLAPDGDDGETSLDPSAPGGPSVPPTGSDPPTGEDLDPSEPEPVVWAPVVLCTSLGPAQVDMPIPARFEGPRDLMRIPPPASGTFAVSYAEGGELRYDALVIEAVADQGDTDAEVLEVVVAQIDGNPAKVVVDPPVVRGQHHEAGYRGVHEGRDLHAHAYSAHGLVFVIDVGTYHDVDPVLQRKAETDLQRMRSSVAFPGLDDGPGATCDGHEQGPPRDDPPVDPGGPGPSER